MTTTQVTVPQVGQAAEPRSFGPITRTHIVRYAGASGDFNPIHHDDGVAQAAGFPNVFSIGMLQAGLLASFATDWLGAEQIRRFQVRFREMVWPGDVCTCTGEVTAVAPDADGSQLVTVALTCTRQTGDVILKGEADFLLA
jgi:acyl dehydratase